MTHYADSSFLVSCYLADSNSAAAKAWLSRHSAALPFTPLHALEIQNAFQLAVFRGLITAADSARALGHSDPTFGRAVSWRQPLIGPLLGAGREK
jgi:predicted nucleic acid-binding protein